MLHYDLLYVTFSWRVSWCVSTFWYIVKSTQKVVCVHASLWFAICNFQLARFVVCVHVISNFTERTVYAARWFEMMISIFTEPTIYEWFTVDMSVGAFLRVRSLDFTVYYTNGSLFTFTFQLACFGVYVHVTYLSPRERFKIDLPFTF